MSYKTALFLPPHQITSGKAVLNAMFSESGSPVGDFYSAFEAEMRDALLEDSRQIPSQVGEWPDMWAHIDVNGSRIKDAKGPPYSYVLRMKIGTKANFYADVTPDRDLLKVAFDIYTLLVKHSPIRPANMRGHHPRGLYRRSHRIFVDGKPTRGKLAAGTVDESSYAQIINQLDYASTLEAPGSHRVYQKVRMIAARKYAKDWDIALSFANPESFGGNIYSSFYAGNPPPYAIPVMTVAPLNSLPKTGFIYKRRRTKRARAQVRRQNYDRLRRRT